MLTNRKNIPRLLQDSADFYKNGPLPKKGGRASVRVISVSCMHAVLSNTEDEY